MLVTRAQEMLRKNPNAVEDALRGRGRLGHIKAQRVIVELHPRNWFAADDQQVALWRVDLLVEVRFEGEDHIIGVERLTVRKPNAAAKLHGEAAAILR